MKMMQRNSLQDDKKLKFSRFSKVLDKSSRPGKNNIVRNSSQLKERILKT